MGFVLIDGSYVPIAAGVNGGLHAATLGLDFHVGDIGLGISDIGDIGLGISDPVAGEWLQTPAESAETRAETAETPRRTRSCRTTRKGVKLPDWKC